MDEQRELDEQSGLADWLPGRLAAVAPSVTVIGDVMLDGWWSGSIDRLCREAPAPVVDISRRVFAPGGAADTALNLAALGARVRVAGLVGCDAAALELRRQLCAAGVNTSHLHEHPGIVTTTKTRISSAAFVASRREELIQAAGAHAVVVTLDRDGTLLLPAVGALHRTWARPATEKQAAGAGDTFVAALTLACAARLPLTTGVDLAQAAADVVVHQYGTSVCSSADLKRHLESFADTAVSADELARHIQGHRAEGRRIVLTNGCFDVLHRGHTRYLNQAKQLGDVLVVALNSDASVRRLKGPDRPINTVADRAAVIAALSCVDYVTVFDTPTPIPLIEKLRPEIYAKGGDYTPKMLAETEAVERFGGKVAILGYVAELSTTAVVQRIRSREGAAATEAPVN